MPKVMTVIVPIIQDVHIGRFIETLYKYTPNNFYLFVIDQTQTDDAYLKYHDKAHLWIKTYRNLGFSKAHNTGIRLAQTPYITLANDDIEFMNINWWQGIVDTFETDKNIVAVNPMSPKEGAWGYGLTSGNKDTWEPPKEFVKDPDDPNAIIVKKPDGTGFRYKQDFSEEDYQFLINNHPRWTKNSVCDAIAMWCTVFKKSGLDEIGLLDEKFYPGGGEDYDLNARAYSCSWPIEIGVCDPMLHRRMVGSTRSWVWHHWSSSKNKRLAELDSDYYKSKPSWNNNDELWPWGFDVWGHATVENGKKIPLRRVKEIFVDEL